jgi:FkbM family methyltransferase
MERATKLGSLNNIKKLGFYPKTIIDVGAQVGTHCLYEVFPDSHHILIEPVQENEAALKQICKNMKKAEYIIAAATSKDCNVDLSVSSNTKYSHACQSNNQNGWTVRQVKGITVDSLCEDKKLQAPYLLKIDVDGTEIDVLKGCIKILSLTEYVVVEATTNAGQRIYDIINFMRNQNFHVYDIVDFLYRPEINDLWQVDVAFVKANSEVIQYKNYKQFTPPGATINEKSLLQRQLNTSGPARKISMPEKCVVCNSPYVSFVKKLPNKQNQDVDLFYCMECESFFSPFSVPNKVSSQLEWHKSILDRNLRWATDLLTNIQQKTSIDGPIIDIGCGIGSLLLAAKQIGLEGIGFDIDEESCIYGSTKYNLKLIGTHWERKNSPQCGLITCISVLEHIHYPRPLIKDLVNVAKENMCSLYISVPFLNRDWWKFLLTDNLTQGHIFEYPHVHITHFSSKGLETVCREFGAKSFEPLKVAGGGWFGFLVSF